MLEICQSPSCKALRVPWMTLSCIAKQCGSVRLNVTRSVLFSLKGNKICTSSPCSCASAPQAIPGSQLDMNCSIAGTCVQDADPFMPFFVLFFRLCATPPRKKHCQRTMIPTSKSWLLLAFYGSQSGRHISCPQEVEAFHEHLPGHESVNSRAEPALGGFGISHTNDIVIFQTCQM